MKKFSFKERLLQIFLLTLMALALLYMHGGFESANTTQPVNDKNAPISVTDINADFKKMEADMESTPETIIKIDECGMVTEEDGHLVTYIKYYHDSNGNLKPKC